MSHVSLTDFDPEEFGRAFGDVIREALDPIRKRMGELEKSVSRIETIEKAMEGRGMRFFGRWNRDADNEAGDVVSHSGSLWVSKRATREVPGTGVDWQRLLRADKRGGFTDEEEQA